MKPEHTILREAIGSKFLNPIRWVGIILFLMIIASPFIWIWYEWSLAWKTGLTGIVGTVIMGYLHKWVRELIEKEIEEATKDYGYTKVKSKFQERLKKLAEERGINLN